MKIYLTGFMGAGKSTVARALAEQLGWEWIDLDEAITSEAGMSIPRIFEEEGEEGFRERERRVLSEVAHLFGSHVVATGGGVPCSEQNRKLMKASGKVVYLEMSAEQLADRLWLERRERPLLSSLSREEFPEAIRSKLEERRLFYKQAGIRVDAGREVEEVVQAIRRTLGK